MEPTQPPEPWRVLSLGDLDALVGEHILAEVPEIYWEDSHGTFLFATELEARAALRDPYYQNFLPEVDWSATIIHEVRVFRPYSTDAALLWQLVSTAAAQFGPLQLWRDGGEWKAAFGPAPTVRALLAPVAVCMAALRAKGILLDVDHARLDRQLGTQRLEMVTLPL